jgi:hypothetical protein
MALTAHRSSKAIVPYRPNHSYAKPIIIRPTVKVAKKKHHRRSGGGSSRGLMDKRRIGIIVGGFGLGLIQKTMGSNIPTIPLLGQAGTIGIAAYFLSQGGKNQLADEVCTAALTVAAYEMGSTGKVVGGAGSQDEGWGASGYVAGV